MNTQLNNFPINPDRLNFTLDELTRLSDAEHALFILDTIIDNIESLIREIDPDYLFNTDTNNKDIDDALKNFWINSK